MYQVIHYDNCIKRCRFLYFKKAALGMRQHLYWNYEWQRQAISLYTHKNNSHLKMLSPPSCCFPPGQLFSSGYEFPPSIYCELASAIFPKEMFANQGQIKACELDSKCVFFPLSIFTPLTVRSKP